MLLLKSPNIMIFRMLKESTNLKESYSLDGKRKKGMISASEIITQRGVKMLRLWKRILILFIVLLMFTSLAYAENWTCLTCGRSNSGNFCPNCGTKKGVWLCPNCGEPCELNFCENCGAPKIDVNVDERSTVGYSDEALLQSFNENNLKLVRASWPAIDKDKVQQPQENQICLNDSFNTLDYDSPVVYGVSPSGNSAVLIISECVFTYYEGLYHPLGINRSRGVEDVYGNLQRLTTLLLPQHMDKKGIAFSSDGRYASFSNSFYAQQGKYFMDPVLIDLSTGDLVLTATYPSDRSSNPSCVTSVAFSKNNRYLYYILYQFMTGQSSKSLYRYNIEQGNTEKCCDLQAKIFDGRLMEISDEKLLCIEEGSWMGSNIVQIECIDGIWKEKNNRIEAKGQFLISNFADLAGDRILIYTDMDSAFARRMDSFNGLMIVQTEDDFSGLNQLLSVSPGYEKMISKPDQSDSTSQEETLPLIFAAAVSPDGQFALIHAGMNLRNDSHLLLVNLDTLECKEVSGVNHVYTTGGMSRPFSPGIVWQKEYLIINVVREGPCLFQFE